MIPNDHIVKSTRPVWTPHMLVVSISQACYWKTLFIATMFSIKVSISLFQLLILIGHLLHSDVQFGVDVRKYTKSLVSKRDWTMCS